MTRTTSTIAIAFAIVLAALVGGCSSKSCADLCTQAQTGHCTTVRGACSPFCTSLDAVKGPASCGTRYDEYQTCLAHGSDVCANDCDAQEAALTDCVTAYCATHTSDADCVTLASSF